MTGFEIYMKANKMADNTIKIYNNAVELLHNHVQKADNEITTQDVLSWIASMNNLSGATVSQRLAGVKAYFSYLEMIGEVESNVTEKIKPPKIEHKEKPYPEAEVIRKMINVTGNVRDKAFIYTLASTGMRFSEISAITVGQYRNMLGEDCREIEILGKGSKHRRVYINDEAKRYIDTYLVIRTRKLGELSDDDYLFASGLNNKLDASNSCKMVKRVARNAGYADADDVCNHWLRAAFATTQAESGTPVTDIQAAMGHSNVQTTSLYIKHTQSRINNTMRKAVF